MWCTNMEFCGRKWLKQSEMGLHLQNIDSTYIFRVYSRTCFSAHLCLILLDQKLFPSQLKYSEDSAKSSFS